MCVLDDLPHKRIHIGVLDLRNVEVETPEVVAARIRAMLERRPAEDLIVAPDCGLKYLPRDVAFEKLRNMVLGRNLVRTEREEGS